MADKIKYRVRLRVQLAKKLNTADLSRSLEVEGREVTVLSDKVDEPLSETLWIVLRARGFLTENEARAFGSRLQRITELAGLCLRLGINVGLDKTTCAADENFARSAGLIEPHERLAPNVHGLTVFPDDGLTRFPHIEIRLEAKYDADDFLSTIQEISEENAELPTALAGMRALNLAISNSQPLAQLVLSISVVEALAEQESWSDNQVVIIKEVAKAVVQEGPEDDTERLEIADAIKRGLQRIGAIESVRRLLKRIGFSHTIREWTRIYGLRSAIFHGRSTLTESETSQLAQDAILLSGRIVLRVATIAGVRMPSLTSRSFPEEEGPCS